MTEPQTSTQVDDVTQETATGTLDEDECLKTRYWSFFLASSIIFFLSGIIVILAYRLIIHFGGWSVRRHKTPAELADEKEQESTIPGCCTKLKWFAEGWISGQTTTGKVMVSLSCVLSIGSLIIYLIDASRPGNKEETCIPWVSSISQQFDLVFNLFFMFFFVIRLIAANDKLMFWLDVHSIVDYFTIPPAFVGIYLSRQWLGLRFLRALRLMSFPDILQYLSLLRTSNSIRLAQLSCIFVSVWLAASGFIHLVETSGDPFYGFDNAQDLTYWECVYMALVTMSTVGYGDIYCKTTLGRLFITFFIMGALAMFAGFVPEIMEIIGRRERYGGAYDKPAGVKHIVVCGHITYESVHNFLRDFLHEDRENSNVKCIFLENRAPDLELNALFKRHFTHVEYFKGTIMSTRDLERVKLKSADACLIMVNPRCRDPDAADASNIMRVIAAKNFHEDIRIIVQLMRYQNKAFCVNLPSWTNKDQIICLAEMKLGFMAQGCLAPGFSTLLANLFVMRSYKKLLAKIQTLRNSQWLDQYLRGAGMEVYTEHFSAEFHGHPFPAVAQFCYKKLELLLVAVATSEDGSDIYSNVVLNPDKSFIIDSTTKGFFICEEQEQVKRALHFCRKCHDKHFLQIRVCDCKPTQKSPNGSFKTNGAIALIVDDDTLTQPESCSRRSSKGRGISVKQLDLELNENNNSDGLLPARTQFADLVPVYMQRLKPPIVKKEETFDSTGLFHWCSPRTYDECMLTHDINREVIKVLEKHIVLCTFAEDKSPEMGLINFVMPLRASCLRYDELKTIVIIGNKNYLQNEWDSINTFPDVYIKVGSPLNRADLRSVKINSCHMCVILTANDTATEDPTLVDKEAILCSLNIKTMLFHNLAEIWKTSGPNRLFRFKLMGDHNSRMRRGGMNQTQASGASVPMLTELAHEFNAQFVDQDDDDDPDIPLYMTQPFACGRTFAASVLDSLMSTTYFNPESLNLVRMLITGGSTPTLEQTLAEGHGMMQGLTQKDLEPTRDRSRVALIPLADGQLDEYSCDEYGNLFAGALEHHGILCMGLYRNVDPRGSACNYNRFIVTNPPASFSLIPSDKVYCLLPYEPEPNSQTQGQLTSQMGSPSTNNNTLHNMSNPSSPEHSQTEYRISNTDIFAQAVVERCDTNSIGSDATDSQLTAAVLMQQDIRARDSPPLYNSLALQDMDVTSPTHVDISGSFDSRTAHSPIQGEESVIHL